MAMPARTAMAPPKLCPPVTKPAAPARAARSATASRSSVHRSRSFGRRHPTRSTPMPLPGAAELLAEPVVEAVGGPEQPAHRAAAEHDHRLGVRVAVPEDGEQPAQGEHLEVAQRRGDRHLLASERLEQVERARPRASRPSGAGR